LLLITTPCSLTKEVALDELRYDRDDHLVDVPLLPANVRVVNHVLSRKSDPDWKFAKLHNFGDAQAEGDGPDVARFVGFPVRQGVS
jgi:hypothetical protein